MSLVFGLTGGICCGKSAVSKFFAKQGVAIVDADLCARDVVEPGTIGLSLIQKEFGSEVILPTGFLDRIKLGNIVFNSLERLAAINKIMAPLIDHRAMELIQNHISNGEKLIVYDAALLVEQDLADLYRPLVVVATSYDTQLTRLMKRNNLTEAEAHARIDKQLSSDEKIKHADYIIYSNGTLEELEQRTLEVLACIKDSNKNQIQKTAS